MNKIFSLRNAPRLQSIRNYCSIRTESELLGIPLFVERKPSDLLKAIASTIGNDPTAAKYKFIDDPYLIPFDERDKRDYSLSKESGKKTAIWIRDQHPEYFHQQFAEPRIPAFDTELPIPDDMVVDENFLLELIGNMEVARSVKVYELCVVNDVALSQETLQALLECVAFYQDKEPTDLTFTEELYHSDLKDVETIGAWHKGTAEELFEILKENGVKPYSAMIRGLCRHNQFDDATVLYNEALQKNFVLDTTTFNSIISLSHIMPFDAEPRWKYVTSVMEQMAASKVAPDVITFNKAFECLYVMNSWKNSANLSISLLKEMKQLGIKPSLTAYNYCLSIHYRKSHNAWHTPDFMEHILKELEASPRISIRDPNDVQFFYTAMDTCVQKLSNWPLCVRLHKLLEWNNNAELLGKFKTEQNYYKHYFFGALRNLPIKEVMDIYDYLVPNIYFPHKFQVQDLIKMIALSQDLHYLVRVWKNVVHSHLKGGEDLVSIFLVIINNAALDNVDPNVKIDLLTYVDEMWESFKLTAEPSQKRGPKFQFQYNGKILGNYMEIFMKYRSLAKTLEVIQPLLENPNLIEDIIPNETILNVFNAALKADDGKICFIIQIYANRNNLECCPEISAKMEDSFSIEKTEQ